MLLFYEQKQDIPPLPSSPLPVTLFTELWRGHKCLWNYNTVFDVDIIPFSSNGVDMAPWSIDSDLF